MSSPLVSIIIPTYNREKKLQRALNSVLSQTYSNWEVCIVDNHSSDKSIDLIDGYNDSRIKVYKIQNNGIIGASRNTGIKNAKGKYLAFLDSDDWWSSKKLEKSIKLLEKEKASLVYHDCFIVNKEHQRFFIKTTKSRKLNTPVFDDLIVNGNCLITSSVVLKSEFMTKISGFSTDSRLVAIEDYDAWLKIAIINQKFLKIPEVLGFYWLGGESESSPKKTIQTLDVLEKNFEVKISKLNLKKKTYWISYSKARAYYKINMRTEALSEFYSTLAKHPTLKIKLKTIIMIIIIKLNIA